MTSHMSLINKFSIYIDESIPVYCIESEMMNNSAVVKNIGYGTSIWQSINGDLLEVECLFPSLVFRRIDLPLDLLGEAPAYFELPSSELNYEVISIYNDENFFIIKWGDGTAYSYGVNGIIFVEESIVMGIGVIKFTK